MTTTIPASAERATLPDLDRWPALAPVPEGLRTVVARQVAGRLLQRVARRLPVRIEMPEGRPVAEAPPDAPLLVVRRPTSFLSRLGRDGLIGFGEAYMAGDWDAPDLAGVLTVFAAEVDRLVPLWLQRLRGLYDARHPVSDANTVGNARSNIARHYDLSNALFGCFLDETMTYSSALFDREAGRPRWDDLADAQRRKIDRLLDLARVGEGTRLLEIGTGWGALAIRAAERGATVRSVTLSVEQQALARERIAAAGHAGRVSVDLLDYRQVDGDYDAVVSVEMIEAVGHEYWRTYFEKIDDLLVPGGRAALQAITMPHDRMIATRNTHTWVHKYIFPGGCLPSTEAITRTVQRHTRLRVAERLAMGGDYAETLRLWDERFRAAAERVADLGFDEVFRRMWHFYLEYSRSGFTSGYLDVQQILLTKTGEQPR